jgi:hypothetical protein
VIKRLGARGLPTRVLPRFDRGDRSSWARASHMGDPGALPAENGLRASGADGPWEDT